MYIPYGDTLENNKDELFMGEFREISKDDYLAGCFQYLCNIVDNIHSLSNMDSLETDEGLNDLASNIYDFQDKFELQDENWLMPYLELSDAVLDIYIGSVDSFDSIGDVDRFTGKILGTTMRQSIIYERSELGKVLEAVGDTYSIASGEGLTYFRSTDGLNSMAVDERAIYQLQADWLAQQDYRNPTKGENVNNSGDFI